MSEAQECVLAQRILRSPANIQVPLTWWPSSCKGNPSACVTSAPVTRGTHRSSRKNPILAMGLMGVQSSGCRGENCSLVPDFSNCSHQDCFWEEPVFGWIELVCVTIIYVPLMLFGLLGNVLTILVVWLRPHMRSSTYLYLSSMAISDLLILLLLPLDLYKLWRPRPWPLGDLACKLTMFLSECCTFCTILHITFLSLERYLAVCWPITAKTLVTRRRTRAIIGCLWLGAAVSAAPVLLMVGVEDVGGDEVGFSQECRCTQYAISSGLLSAMMILSNLYFLVPLSILGLVYSLIGRTLWLRPKSSRKEQSHRNTVKMLGVIVLAVGDRQESNPNTDVLADVFEPLGHSDSDVHFYEPLSQPDEMAARALTEDRLCDTCAETKDRTGPQTGSDQQVITETEPPLENSDRHTHNTETLTHPTQSDTKRGANLHRINTTLPMQDTTTAMNTQHISSGENTILPTNDTLLGDPLWSSDMHSYFLYYLSQYFNLVSSVLFYLSAAINPLLYNLMSARYRLAVRSLVRRSSQTQAQHLRTLMVRQSTTTV
ncbi:Growth hormone secretagogue receptor type 1, partial [Oryzias melastigma]